MVFEPSLEKRIARKFKKIDAELKKSVLLMKKESKKIEKELKKEINEIRDDSASKIEGFKDSNKKDLRNLKNLMRVEIREMQKSIETMRNYLKNKVRQDAYARKQDNKLREEFRKNVDEFTQKSSQLSIALSRVNAIEKTLVVKKDLAIIEEKIREGFKEEIDDFRDEIDELNKSNFHEVLEKNGKINKKKNKKNKKKKNNGFWFFMKKNK
jgi:hypothetical protein